MSRAKGEALADQLSLRVAPDHRLFVQLGDCGGALRQTETEAALTASGLVPCCRLRSSSFA